MKKLVLVLGTMISLVNCASEDAGMRYRNGRDKRFGIALGVFGGVSFVSAVLCNTKILNTVLKKQPKSVYRYGCLGAFSNLASTLGAGVLVGWVFEKIEQKHRAQFLKEFEEINNSEEK